KVSMLAKAFGKSRRQRHVSQSATLRHSHMTLPFRPLDTELPLVKVHIAPFKRRDLAQSQPRFAAEQNYQLGTPSELPRCGHEPLKICEIVEGCRGFRCSNQSDCAWYPVDHVPFDSLLEHHVQHREHVVQRFR